MRGDHVAGFHGDVGKYAGDSESSTFMMYSVAKEISSE